MQIELTRRATNDRILALLDERIGLKMPPVEGEHGYLSSWDTFRLILLAIGDSYKKHGAMYFQIMLCPGSNPKLVVEYIAGGNDRSSADFDPLREEKIMKPSFPGHDEGKLLMQAGSLRYEDPLLYAGLVLETAIRRKWEPLDSDEIQEDE